MVKLSLARLAVAVGSLALPLAAAAGVASATPDLGPAVNTTCTYPQLVSALNAQGPEASAVFNQTPVLQVGLQQFLASGPEKRRAMAQEMVNTPAFGPYLGPVQAAFNTCNSF
jgi:hemophore-related protein